MEQNLPVVAKRVWSIVRVVFFMLRKSLSLKRKLMVDLNMMLKRGKIASKALTNLLHQYHHQNHLSPPPREYEFSCSNTPAYTFPTFLTKKPSKTNLHFFGCAHAPPTLDDDAVKAVLEMLNNTNNNDNDNNMVVAPSPYLPGFGRSPFVRQLRITDSPFPLRDVDEGDNGVVDKAAEEFIKKFYKELKLQKING